MTDKIRQILTLPVTRKNKEKKDDLSISHRRNMFVVKNRQIQIPIIQEEEINTQIKNKISLKNKEPGRIERLKKVYNTDDKKPRSGKASRHLKYTKRKIDIVFNYFPSLKETQNPLPLAINIHIQMIDYVKRHKLPLTEKEIKNAIRYYTLQKTYYLAILKYNWRRDIHGNKTTRITKKEKQFAAKKIEK